MTWEAAGAIGEVVGGAAVVATLVYLAAQIRQNTRSVRSAIFHNVTKSFNEQVTELFRDPELARIYDTGLIDYDSLSQADRLRFQMFVQVQFRNYENLYFQHRQRLLDPEIWEARHDLMVEFLRQPGVQRWWKRRGMAFGKSFHDLVEGHLEGSIASAESGPPE